MILNEATLQIVHTKDGMYDVYGGIDGKWLFSYSSADNMLSRLAKYGPIQVEFVDEMFD